MARKKKKDDKDDLKLPEFDEVEYVRKERRDAKATYVTVGYAVVFGLVSFALTAAGQFMFAALFGVFGLIFLRHVYPLLHIDTLKFDWKNWAGNALFYIFTWLAIWIMFVNPPISDLSPPDYGKPGIYHDAGDGNWSTEGQPLAGERTVLLFVVSDNVEVREADLALSGPGGVLLYSGPLTKTDREKLRDLFNYTYLEDKYQAAVDDLWSRLGVTFYHHEFEAGIPGTYSYNVTSTDINDHTSTLTRTFTVTNAFLEIRMWNQTSPTVIRDISAGETDITTAGGENVTIRLEIDTNFGETPRNVTISVDDASFPMTYEGGIWKYEGGLPTGIHEVRFSAENEHGLTTLSRSYLVTIREP